MGESRDTVSGCPSIDLAAEVLASPGPPLDALAKYGGVGSRLRLDDGYLVVMQHPVTTEYDSARQHAVETLQAVREVGLPTLWFWPNVDAGSDGTSNAIRSFRENEKPENIRFFKNMEPLDFLRLLYGSKCLVGNSSVGIRECSYLGVPVVNVGSRQSGRDRGRNVQDVGYDRREIVDAIGARVAAGRLPSDPLYGDGHARERIAELLASRPLTIQKRLTY